MGGSDKKIYPHNAAGLDRPTERTMGQPCIIQGESSRRVEGSKFRGELLKFICVWGLEAGAEPFKSIFSEVNMPVTEAAQQHRGDLHIMHRVVWFTMKLLFFFGPKAFAVQFFKRCLIFPPRS